MSSCRRLFTSTSAHYMADPSAPLLLPDGRLQLYGSGNVFLEWEGGTEGNAWERFFSEAPKLRELRLYHPDGSPILFDHLFQGPWDVSVELWPEFEEPVLYAGVMTPTEGGQARWPDDNWTRRVYAFRKTEGGWTRAKRPLFSTGIETGWLGHCYGHHFVHDEKGAAWVFYERVSLAGAGPERTELFARKMLSPFETDREEIKIFGITDPPIPTTIRRTGNFLVEGPRPVRVQTERGPRYFLFFSAGDLLSENQGINVLESASLTGPYEAHLEAGDFKNYGKELRRAQGFVAGPSRPCLFTNPRDQSSWMLFHAAEMREAECLLDGDLSPEKLALLHRHLYLIPWLVR